MRNFIKMGHNINVTISPLIAALYKGQEDVVRLLVEAGAECHTELNHWCDQAIIDEPRLEPVLRRMMSIAMLYDDFKAYGPFGFQGYQVNSADVGNIPREGTIHAIIVQFSLLDGSAITALQFVHMVNGQPFPCKIHHTNEAHAGNFDALNNFSHVERLTLDDNEYVISAELGVGDRFITSIRFTVRPHDVTNLHPQGTLHFHFNSNRAEISGNLPSCADKLPSVQVAGRRSSQAQVQGGNSGPNREGDCRSLHIRP